MKRVIYTLSLVCIVMACMAKPAYRGSIVRTLEDGTEKIVYLHGDEHFHYMTDIDGQWLDEKTLVPLTAAERTARLDRGIANQMKRKQQKTQTATPINIAPRGLLILVNFADVTFSTPKATIDSMLNGHNFTRNYQYLSQNSFHSISSSGSARQYFYDQSYGKYNPVFDVIGPVTLANNMSYYGENDRYGDEKNATKMIKDACELADVQFGIDYTQYDNDGDNYVDFVYVIYAGYGEADSGLENTVWPHQWNLKHANLTCTIDGKKIDRYACGNEMNFNSKHHDGIGTFCHEFSHVLGIPDLYTTNSSTHHTLCDWDIMDYGPYNNDGNTPPAYSGYERFFMGWLKPRVLTDPEYVWLNPINFKNGEVLLLCNGDAHNLIGNDPSPSTFYLLESRKKEGWDSHLPGEGLLITKISYNEHDWRYNTINNDPYDMGVDILEARQNTTSYGRMTDAYPAGSRWWTGFTGHEVTNIALQPGGAITFSYRGADITGTENPTEEVHTIKLIQDGQVIIQRNGNIYNMQGTKIQ